ncbi:MBL fold metallo-hydrolase [Emticicia sp. SJ17W-69]|uniref:MBL fold metallo-hydrolase n=1 Tax=Emticicia sp. SJ17W-69 TaxID=3421657 RepID=UPI003EB6CE91
MVISILAIIVLLTIAIFLFMQQAKFGKTPAGERLERIKKSPNYKDGSFKNLSFTPDLAEGVTYYSVMKEFIFGKKVRLKPIDEIPHTKVDLLHLKSDENILVWFGHSSYFMQLDGKTFLVDPVLSGAASPIKFTTPSFKGTDVYIVADFPNIDYLFISHDHYDHLDYETIMLLKPKVKKIITGLGTGEHFESWGFDLKTVIEEDWNTKIELEKGFVAYTTPARHFSGRGFSRNRALWTSFVLQTPTNKIYIGGDSGYDTHFAEIGKTYGGFDLAILENGQYDKSWKYIHMMPEEVVQAAKDLKAKRLFPVHSSKFALGNHPWDEPLNRVSNAAEKENFPIITPIIGQKVNLGDSTQTFGKWWKNVQ